MIFIKFYYSRTCLIRTRWERKCVGLKIISDYRGSDYAGSTVMVLLRAYIFANTFSIQNPDFIKVNF